METNITIEEENVENDVETCHDANTIKVTKDIVSLMESLQKMKNMKHVLSNIKSEIGCNNNLLDQIVEQNNRILEYHDSRTLDSDKEIIHCRPADTNKNEDKNASLKLKKSYHSPIESEIAMANLEKDLELAKNKKKYIKYLRTLHKKKPTHSQFKNFFTKILSSTCISRHNVRQSKYKKKLTSYVEWTKCILQAYDITHKDFETFLKVNLPKMKKP